jgi:hypothetical protein
MTSHQVPSRDRGSGPREDGEIAGTNPTPHCVRAEFGAEPQKHLVEKVGAASKNEPNTVPPYPNERTHFTRLPCVSHSNYTDRAPLDPWNNRTHSSPGRPRMKKPSLPDGEKAATLASHGTCGSVE